MKRLFAIAWALVLIQLVTPSTLLAAPSSAVGPASVSSSPSTIEGVWQLEWPEADKRMAIEAVPGGWSVEDLTTGEVQPIGLSPESVKLTVLERKGDRFVASVVTDEPLGGSRELTLSGELDPLTGTGSISVYTRDGEAIAEGLRLQAPEGATLDATIVIVITAGGLVSLAAIVACSVLALAQNCISSCHGACESAGGMQFAHEGQCGTCTCTCWGNG